MRPVADRTETEAARRMRARNGSVPELRVDRLDDRTQITIDGRLDESAWQRARSVSFNDPSTGQPNPRLPTQGSVRLLWSSLGFYVGFEVRDANVVGGFAPSDTDPHLWTKDTVEIMVDPDGDGDNQDYYEIQLSPQNLVFDSQFDAYNAPVQRPNGPFGHQEWTSEVNSAVSVRGTLDQPGDTDIGYVVEALLPWKAFGKAKRAPPRPGDAWRMNFYAIQENHGCSWSPILGAGNFHKASRFGRVFWADKR
jgi:hypothetical protein